MPELIDPNGTTISGVSGLLRVEPRLGHAKDPVTYAVLNLGFVEFRRTDLGHHIRCRPSKLTPSAFAQLMFVLSDDPDRRVALCFHQQSWHHELLSSGDAAVARLLELIDAPTPHPDSSIYSRTIDLQQSEATQTKLDALLTHWKPRVSWTQFGAFIDRATELAEGRHVLFEYDGDAGCFRIREFGQEVPDWAKITLMENIGRPVAAIADPVFGQSCQRTYSHTLEIFRPRAEAVDATVIWPTFGTRRSQFWRTLFPMIDPGKRLWLLSASLPDARINLVPNVASK